MHPDTMIFVRSLFERCTSDKSFISLTAIHPDGEHPTPSRHIPLHDNTALERAVGRLVSANARGWGAYLGVAPRQRDLGRWSRGGRGDLLALPALYVDIDDPDDLLLFRVLQFEQPPSCLIHSGHGYHLYWYLETPTRDFKLADQALRALARHFVGDAKMTVAQSMRLPGTWNTKPGQERGLCRIVQHHPDWRYPLSAFSRVVRDMERHTSNHRKETASYVQHTWTHDAPHQAAIDAVTKAVIHQLDGHHKPNGFIAARCPYCHNRDKPGMHFSYHPASGWGYCFGKHGKISLTELREMFGLPTMRT